MCYSIPISWRNVFGGSFADIPLPWFYILGIFLVAFIFFKYFYKSRIDGYGRALAGLVTLEALVLGAILLLATGNNFFNESLGQFLTLSFYNLILFFCLVKGPLIGQPEMNRIRKAYLLSGLVTSIGIILQFVFHRFAGITLGNIDYAKDRILYGFMFIDISAGTLYLASTALMAIIYADKYMERRIIPYISAALMIIAAAITSSRTGIAAFIATLFLYMLSKKGIYQKLFGITTAGIFILVSFFFFSLVRPMNNASSYILDGSGRIQGYLIGLEFFMKSPFLGTGFSRSFTSILMGGIPVPHFSLLQYLVQTGIVYTGMVFGVIAYAQMLAIKKSFIEGWILLLTMIGSCLIPDIFSSRFIIIILMVIFIQESYSMENNINKEISHNYLAGENNGKDPYSVYTNI
jgi:hypothetical protein